MVGMVLDAVKKTGRAIGTGNTQQQLGLQSPHLPSAIDRWGRFLFTFSAGWIAVSWYTGYVNVHTQPGSGPTLVLPGLGSKNGSGSPSRPDPAVPSFGNGGVNGKGGGPAYGNQIPGAAGPVRTRIASVALQMVGRRNIQYKVIRPFPTTNLLANPCYVDCSAFVTLVYYTAKAPDPNGLNYALPMEGSSNAMWQHGVQVKNPNIGDLRIYSDHVVVVVGVNPPTVVGIGSPSDPGPVKRTVAQQDAIQTGVGQTVLGYRSYV